MIGRTDIVIPTGGGHAPLDLCLRVIRRYWPDAIFEKALTGNRVERYELLPNGGVKELLVYQNAAAAKEWDEKGADPALENTMIHLLLGEKTLTAVVDNPAEQPMRQLLESIRMALAPSDGPNGAAQDGETQPGKSEPRPHEA